MVGTNKALESDFLTVRFAEDSPSKTFAVLGEGKYEETDYGEKLRIPVEIDGKTKIWTPNKDSVRTCRKTWGLDTTLWVGKIAKISIISIGGKDAISVFPQETEVVSEEKIK